MASGDDTLEASSQEEEREEASSSYSRQARGSITISTNMEDFTSMVFGEMGNPLLAGVPP